VRCSASSAPATATKATEYSLVEVDTVARLGGDEFAVLLPRIQTAEGALAVAGKLQAAMEQPFLLEGLSLEVEASIGVALYPEHGNDPATTGGRPACQRPRPAGDAAGRRNARPVFSGSSGPTRSSQASSATAERRWQALSSRCGRVPICTI
jgi:hypothetical protein